MRWGTSPSGPWLFICCVRTLPNFAGHTWVLESLPFWQTGAPKMTCHWLDRLSTCPLCSPQLAYNRYDELRLRPRTARSWYGIPRTKWHLIVRSLQIPSSMTLLWRIQLTTYAMRCKGKTGLLILSFAQCFQVSKLGKWDAICNAPQENRCCRGMMKCSGDAQSANGFFCKARASAQRWFGSATPRATAAHSF